MIIGILNLLVLALSSTILAAEVPLTSTSLALYLYVAERREAFKPCVEEKDMSRRRSSS